MSADVVMYLEKGGSEELFTQEMAHEDAKQAAGKLDREGYEVIAIITAEHAAERKAAAGRDRDGGSIPGTHLTALLDDVVRRFRQDYPKVRRESALEVVSLLCTLSLEGETDLQTALLDEVHAPGPAGSDPWRRDMVISIANRRPEGE